MSSVLEEKEPTWLQKKWKRLKNFYEHHFVDKYSQNNEIQRSRSNKIHNSTSGNASGGTGTITQTMDRNPDERRKRRKNQMTATMRRHSKIFSLFNDEMDEEIEGTSLFIFGRKNKFRIIVFRLLNNFLYKFFIILTIAVSCV